VHFRDKQRSPHVDDFTQQEVIMQRSATAVWEGGLKDGRGTVSTESGVLSESQYSFSTRFENGTGTNPEELLASAHAGCYSMALSLVLGESGITPERVQTNAAVTIEPSEDGFTITAVHLDTRIKAPGANRATVEEAAEKAKGGCPVSKLFNAEITLAASVDT
jgi:osmotically inducible protein OsmC